MIYYQQRRTPYIFVTNKTKSNSSFLQTIRLPVLVSTAIAIIGLCFIVYSWSEEQSSFRNQQFSDDYNQGLANASAAFLGELIDSDNTDSIEVIGQRLAQQPYINKLSIYKRNGQLLFQNNQSEDKATTQSTPETGASKPSIPQTIISDPVIANISFEGRHNGYLIVYFNNITQISVIANKENNWQHWFLSNNIIWLFGLLVWLTILTLVYADRWSRPKASRSKHDKKAKAPQPKHNGQLLKELLKHNKKHSKNAVFSSYIVIKADWSKLNKKQNNTLLRVLNRWLPQNGLFATQFDHNLLTLGLPQEHANISRIALHALERCLQNLQLAPKIILHELSFEQNTYDTFFKVIEPGIWFEEPHKKTLLHRNWGAQKTIEVEIEINSSAEPDNQKSPLEGQSIALCQLKAPDAQQFGLIERQVRFLSDI